MKICVVGCGYVGLSLAILISQKYRVSLLDLDKNKIEQLKSKISPIDDKLIKDYISNSKLDLHPTINASEAYDGSKFVIVATQTNYDKAKGTFDTSAVEQVINDTLIHNPKAYIIIKSTIPLGFTNKMRVTKKNKNITFSPEFLREGKALYDNLYPSRIVIGDNDKNAKEFADILIKCSKIKKDEEKIYFMNSSEAESVKLFSNTYLAMRVSFFNELDSFAQNHKLTTKDIIDGVSSDRRIGEYYNNPSFGYGGYCLPKDTKQLLNNFETVPNNLMRAIIESNKTRKEFIAQKIIEKKPETVGVYRLTMKTDSDNFRESAVIDIIKILNKNGINVIVYEPLLNEIIKGTEQILDLDQFFQKSDIIIANRFCEELEHMKHKVFTRDIFSEN